MKLTIQELQAYELAMLSEFVRICEKNDITYFLHAGNALGAIRHGGWIPWDHDTDCLVPENQIEKMCACLHKELPKKFFVDYHSVNGNMERFFPRIGLSGYKTDVLHVDIFRLIGVPDKVEDQEKFLKATTNLYIDSRAIKSKSFRDLKSGRYKIRKLFLLPVPLKTICEKYNKACRKYPYEKARYVANAAGKYGMKNVFKKQLYEEWVEVDFDSIKVRVVKDYDFYLKQYYGDYMKLPPEKDRNATLNRTFIVEEVEQ